MSVRHAVVILSTLALGACAHGLAITGRTFDSAKETSVMTKTSRTDGTGKDSTSINPKLNAEHVLLRLLELIRSSKSAAEFTQEHLSRVMGVEMPVHAPGEYGFGEKITPDWWYSLEMRVKPKTGGRFNFRFDSAPGTSLPMTDICQIDFDQFTAALEEMGFTRQRYYGEHGRFINDWFERGNMRVEVYPRGEADDPIDKISHKCVEMVLIP